MAGLLSDSENWAQFSDDWSACLQSGPRRLDYFKMKEAAGCGGQFYGWSEPERDRKLLSL